MKKNVLSIFAIIFIANAANAQIKTNNVQKKNRRGYLNLLVNLDGFKNYTVPPIMLTSETVFDDTYSLEGGLGNLSYASSEIYGIKTDAFAIGAYLGANYYFNRILKLDMDKFTLSGGAGFMYTTGTVSVKSDAASPADSSTTTSDFGFVANAKGRYFFTPKLAVIAQANFAKGGSSFFGGLSYQLH